MKKLLVATLAIMLVACGGESDSENESFDAPINQDLKRGTTEPAITTINETVQDGDSIALNQKFSGSVATNGDFRVSFTAAESGLVVVKLTGNGGDLDLDVYGLSDSVDQESVSLSSNEIVVFRATQGNDYRVRIEEWSGEASGSYTLTIAAANRVTLGMSSNEYLTEVSGTEEETCDGRTDEESFTSYDIINPTGGYFASLSGYRSDFTAVNGNTIQVSASDRESGDGWSESSSMSASITLNPSTGSISINSTGNYEYSESGYSESCTYSSTASGSIVL